MVKRIIYLVTVFVFIHLNAIAQSDSGSVTLASRDTLTLDSLSVIESQKKTDSLKLIGDSLAMVWIKAPDPNRPNKFRDSILKVYTVDNFNFEAWSKNFDKKQTPINQGELKLKGDRWVIIVIIGLILLFSILKNVFFKELSSIVQSFYSSRIHWQINKEDMLFNSWPFLFLYLLFGLTIGMFLYLFGKHHHLPYSNTGFEKFLVLSVIVIGSFTIKILALRILGFLLGEQKTFREYITILYLGYFNAALIFLPLIFAFSLTPGRFAAVYSYLAIFTVTIIFLFQIFRAGANILSNYQFSKTYLIIYLCALEVCPLLILIKALRI